MNSPFKVPWVSEPYPVFKFLWMRIRVLRGWIWIRIRSITDRIRNPEGTYRKGGFPRPTWTNLFGFDFQDEEYGVEDDYRDDDLDQEEEGSREDYVDQGENDSQDDYNSQEEDVYSQGNSQSQDEGSSQENYKHDCELWVSNLPRYNRPNYNKMKEDLAKKFERFGKVTDDEQYLYY